MGIRLHMDRAWTDAKRNHRQPTHWLMTPEQFDRFRYEGDRLPFPAEANKPTYRHLPIFVTRRCEDDFELRDGPVADRYREDELRRQLHELNIDYGTKAQPLIDELVKLEAAKPPRPAYITFEEATNVTPEMWDRWIRRMAGFTGDTPEKPTRAPSEEH